MNLKALLPHGALLALGALSFLLDAPTRAWVDSHASREFIKIMGLVGDWGDWPELMAISIILWGAARLAKKVQLARLITILAIGSTLSGMAVNTIRLTSGRTRPNNTEVAQGFYGLRHEGRWLVGHNKFNSFPSGHMATASGFVLPAVLLHGTPALPLLVFPATMAVARITTGAHHFSDTICSFILSTWVCILLIRHCRQSGWFQKIVLSK